MFSQLSAYFLPNLPNVITVFRIALVPPVALLLLRDDYRLALILVFVAGVSDGLDGWLARAFGWRSRLGAVLDPLADKLLLVVTFSCLGWKGLLPLWLVGMVVLRDLYLVIGGVVYNRWFERIDMVSPSYLSKCNTGLQIALALLVMYDVAWPLVIPAPALFVFNRVVLVTTVITFAHYAWTWGQRARAVGLKHQQPPRQYNTDEKPYER